MHRRLSPSEPAPLRQSDWRFLLPNPDGKPWDHVVLLGGPAGLASFVVESGIARRATREITAEPCADALVVFGAVAHSLERAVTCLRPGGSLYAEIGGLRLPSGRRSPAGIGRALRRLGLRQIRTYRVFPSLSRREAYLPLDGVGPASWYVRNVYAARTFRRRLAGTGLWLAAKLNVRLRGWLVSNFAVTAVTPESTAPPSLLGHPELPKRSSSSEDRLLVLTGGDPQDVYRRVVLLPFGPGAAEPDLVIKLWRSPERNDDTADEQSTLRSLRSGPIGLEPGLVPEALGTIRWGRLVAGVESYCPGRSFAISSLRWGRPRSRKLEDLDAVLSGLARFYAGASIRREPWGSRLFERLDVVLKRYEAELPTTPGERSLFEVVRERSEALRGVSIPLVWSHPDLGPSNVLIRAGGITLIDWARAEEGLPLQDALYLALISCFEICHARDENGRLRVFRSLFLEADGAQPMVTTVRKGLEGCLRAMDVDRRFFPILVVWLWVSRSLGRLDRSRALARGERGVNPKVGNPYQGYVRVLAEGAHGLFEGPARVAGR